MHTMGTQYGAIVHGRRVDTDHRSASGHEPLGQRTVTAANVEHPLAGDVPQQVDQFASEIGDEARIACVVLGRPRNVRG